MNEIYLVYKRMLDQLITYYLPVYYLLRLQQYPVPVNTTYNTWTTNDTKVTIAKISFGLPATLSLEVFEVAFIRSFEAILKEHS